MLESKSRENFFTIFEEEYHDFKLSESDLQIELER